MISCYPQTVTHSKSYLYLASLDFYDHTENDTSSGDI